GNDRWFQHVVIIVRDMDRAYAHLRAHGIAHASTEPQRLPDWNPGAGGIKAFYFRDPDGHFLEILSFPPGKGDPAAFSCAIPTATPSASSSRSSHARTPRSIRHLRISTPSKKTSGFAARRPADSRAQHTTGSLRCHLWRSSTWFVFSVVGSSCHSSPCW